MKKLIKKILHQFALIFIVCLNVVQPFFTNFVELLHCVGIVKIDEKLHSKLIFLVTLFVNKIINVHKFDH